MHTHSQMFKTQPTSIALRKKYGGKTYVKFMLLFIAYLSNHSIVQGYADANVDVQLTLSDACEINVGEPTHVQMTHQELARGQTITLNPITISCPPSTNHPPIIMSAQGSAKGKIQSDDNTVDYIFVTQGSRPAALSDATDFSEEKVAIDVNGKGTFTPTVFIVGIAKKNTKSSHVELRQNFTLKVE